MIRFLDVVLSGFALLVLLPFMIPIIILLALTGEHDVLYKQKRIGRYGRPFYVLKFATMLRDSPNMKGGLITEKDDPRFLPLGKFLRKTKVNELPQLVNVLLGQMSLIGYRPFAEVHYNLYSEEVKDSIARIRPGLSGIGSIVFKKEEEILQRVSNREYVHDNVITPYKGRLETWYVENRSVSVYFTLIFLTVLSFFNPSNQMLFNVFQDLPSCPAELVDYFA